MNVLMHFCCGPCGVACVDRLREEGVGFTGFWYNPNIHPVTEYKARRDGFRQLAELEKFPTLIRDEYGLREFIGEVADDIDGRCVKCYSMRLFAAAETAKQQGFDAFTSTLFISPYQNHELLLRVAEEAADRFGVPFFYRDFRPYFREGQAKARGIGLYMQKYCGCIFSEQDRYWKKKKS